MKIILTLIILFSISTFGFELNQARVTIPTLESAQAPEHDILKTSIDTLLRNAQVSRLELLEVSGQGDFGVSEVYLNNGSRALIDSNTRRLLRLNTVDSIMLNDGMYLDQNAIQDFIKLKGNINIGSGFDGSIYAVGGDGTSSGGS